MLESKTLISLVLCSPIFALIAHLAARRHSSFNHVIHFTLLIVWQVCLVTLLMNYQSPTEINVANWPTHVAINLEVNALGLIILNIVVAMLLMISIFSLADEQVRSHLLAFYSGSALLLLGVFGAIATRDIFNLYVWSEVTLVSSLLILSVSHKRKPHALLHYTVLNIIGTLLLLLAISALYGLAGTLHYYDLAAVIAASSSWAVEPIVLILFFAIAVKAAIFPNYFWLPKAYNRTSISSTLLLSSISSKVFLFIFLNVFLLFKPVLSSTSMMILMIASAATMVFGVLGAAVQQHLRRILTFHVVSQLGYVLFAFVLSVKAAIVAGVYFMVHNMLVKTSLLKISGMIAHQQGTENLLKLGSWRSHSPLLSLLFFISAMSLAGLPPFSGFWGKFLLFKAALSEEVYWLTFVACLVSLFTLYSMLKIWRYGFSEAARVAVPQQHSSMPLLMWISLFLCFGASCLIGLYPDCLLVPLEKAAEETLSRTVTFLGS